MEGHAEWGGREKPIDYRGYRSHVQCVSCGRAVHSGPRWSTMLGSTASGFRLVSRALVPEPQWREKWSKLSRLPVGLSSGSWVPIILSGTEYNGRECLNDQKDKGGTTRATSDQRPATSDVQEEPDSTRTRYLALVETHTID